MEPFGPTPRTNAQAKTRAGTQAKTQERMKPNEAKSVYPKAHRTGHPPTVQRQALGSISAQIVPTATDNPHQQAKRAHSRSPRLENVTA